MPFPLFEVAAGEFVIAETLRRQRQQAAVTENDPQVGHLF